MGRGGDPGRARPRRPENPCPIGGAPPDLAPPAGPLWRSLPLRTPPCRLGGPCAPPLPRPGPVTGRARARGGGGRAPGGGTARGRGGARAGRAAGGAGPDGAHLPAGTAAPASGRERGRRRAGSGRQGRRRRRPRRSLAASLRDRRRRWRRLPGSRAAPSGGGRPRAPPGRRRHWLRPRASVPGAAAAHVGPGGDGDGDRGLAQAVATLCPAGRGPVPKPSALGLRVEPIRGQIVPWTPPCC